MVNVTRCVCPVSGTYSILLTKKNVNVSIIRFGIHNMCTHKTGNEFIINTLFISCTVHLNLLIVNGYLTVASSVVCITQPSFSSSVAIIFNHKNSHLGIHLFK